MPTGVYKRKPMPEKTRKNMSRGIGVDNPFYGKTHTVEVKEKISKSQKGHKMPIHVKNIIIECLKKRKGEAHPLFGKPGYWTGKKRDKQTIQKRLKTMEGKYRGENSWNWKGGLSFEKYTVDWTQTLKRSIRERDNYTCNLCDKKQCDRSFDVHHIDYNKKNCDPKNLVTLCQNCHRKTNGKRPYWTNYFNNKLWNF